MLRVSEAHHSTSGGGDVGDAELKLVRVSQLCYAEECRCGLCEVRLPLREMIFRYWFPGAKTHLNEIPPTSGKLLCSSERYLWSIKL